MSADRPAVVTLREIAAEDREAVAALAVRPDQVRFVAPNRSSFRLAEEEPEGHPWLRAVYAGDHLVGFVMLSDDVAPGDPVHPWRYFLWRLMIDARYQGRGYGRAAVELVVAYLHKRPNANALFTSYVPGEGSPAGFYARLGFAPTGEVFEEEIVLRLALDR